MDRAYVSLAMGRTTGAVLFVIAFNAVMLSTFILLPPAWGLGWVAVFGAAYLCWHFRGDSDRAARFALVRLRSPQVRPIVLLTAVGASLAIGVWMAAVVGRLAPELEPETVSAFHRALLTYETSAMGWAAVILAVVVVVPVVEEFSFRGYIQHTLEPILGPWGGIGFASVLFALTHIGASHWSFLLIPAAVGFLCGLAAWRLGSIWAAVAIHGSWNLMMMAWARAEVAWLADLVPSDPMVLPVATGLLVVGLGGWGLVWKGGPRRRLMAASGRSISGWVAGLALVLGGAGCFDGTAPEEPVEGRLAATLEGAISERYEAEGSYPGPASGEPVTFAAARRGSVDGAYLIGGWRRRGTLQDAIVLEVRSAGEPGAFPLTSGVLVYGQSRSNLAVHFEIVAGEAVLDVVGEDGLRGSFHGTAVEMVPPLPGRAPDTVHITNGTFDVPVLEQHDLAAGESQRRGLEFGTAIHETEGPLSGGS